MPAKRLPTVLWIVLSSVGCFRPAAVPTPMSVTPGSRPSFAGPSAAVPGARPVQHSSNPWKPAAPEREWDYIVLHHTATSAGSVETIHEAHLKRKDKSGNPWLGIGYHFVIGNGNGMGDGAIEPTFRWKQQMHGAHAGAGEYNEHGIGICLVGNFEEGPPTPAQMQSVKRLVGELASAYRIPPEHVIGHRDVKSTACPGKYFSLQELQSSTERYLARRRALVPFGPLASHTEYKLP